MYVILWEFAVGPEKVADFIAAYRSGGAWAKLFAQAEGYIGTELLCSTDRDDDPRFVTPRFVSIDRWQTPEDFNRFQEQFGSEYKKLDTRLDGLTLREGKLGTFVSEGGSANFRAETIGNAG
jgi:heme-degrading monooxygenase HmoA